MKLNQQPNLRVEDFPADQSWLSGLFVQLNPFIQAVNNVLDNNVDYASNIKAITKEYSVTNAFQPFRLQWTLPNSTPVDVRVIKASKTNQQTPCILLLAWEYDAGTSTISVTSMVEVSSSGVSALSGSYKYTLRASI